MSESHIIKLLESRSPASFTPAEIEAIRAHTALCVDCKRAYEAAQASWLLLQERASAVIPPTPFFENKVLAAIREQSLVSNRFEFLKLWQVARPLVISMGVLTLLLLAFTFLTDRSFVETEAPNVAALSENSPEWVLVGQDENDDQVSSSQALTLIYEQESDSGGADGKQP